MSGLWLWSDIIWWALMIIWGYALYCLRRHPLLKERLSVAFKRRRAVAAGIVFLFCLLIASLDSMHFYDPQAPQHTYSVLDTVLPKLALQTERTYSAPFAVVEYETPGGQLISLQHVVSVDVLKRVLFGASIGLVLGFGLIGCLRPWLPWQRFWGMCLLGLCVFVGVVVACMNSYHVCGTDKIGRDVLYMSLKSLRTGLLIGFLTTTLMIPLAVSLGALAGYCKGKTDDVIQYIYTTLSAIPGILLIAAAILSLQTAFILHFPGLNQTQQGDFQLLLLCTILGLTGWTGLCRLVRGETLKLSQMPFVQSAQILGRRPPAIIWCHIVPNLVPIILMSLVMEFSEWILAEAVLSYVGVGVGPETFSFGNLINGARLELARDPLIWWPLATAFFWMVLLVLSANLLAEQLRDALDPQYHLLR